MIRLLDCIYGIAVVRGPEYSSQRKGISNRMIELTVLGRNRGCTLDHPLRRLLSSQVGGKERQHVVSLPTQWLRLQVVFHRYSFAPSEAHPHTFKLGHAARSEDAQPRQCYVRLL